MANGHNNPFNKDVVAIDSIVESENQLSHKQERNTEKKQRHQDLINFLLGNNQNNQCLDSNDSSSFNIVLQSVSDNDFKRLKYLTRSIIWPVNHPIRRQLWLNILTLYPINSSKQPHHLNQTSQTALTTISTFGDNNLSYFSSKSNQWPKCVDTTNLCFYYLTEPTGHSLLQRILLTFALHYPDITYCPTLQPFTALFLHYHNENEVLYILQRLLVKNWLCGGTYLEWEANCNVFKKLLSVYYKAAADIIDLHYPNTKVFYQQWFWWIFRYLPFSYLVKIMDCMLLEGPKVLFRVSLALVYFYAKRIKNESQGNIQNITDFCQQISIPIDRLLYVAFHIRNFKRRTIEQLTDHEEKAVSAIPLGCKCETRNSFCFR